MPQSLFSSKLVELPFHAQLMLVIMLGSALACLAVVLPGLLRRLLMRGEARTQLPLPGRFPTPGDQLYTAFFVLLLLNMAALNLLTTPEPASTGFDFGWMSFIVGLSTLVGLYLPMLVRYGLVHGWHRPTHPWWSYLVLPLLPWAAIYASALVLDQSGVLEWLIRETGCPEYQELVLIFSRGEMMQKLYIIISAVIIAPIAEECCFRGFLYTTLRRWGGCVAAALSSALLFGAIHASLAQMLPLTIFGIVQCIAYEKARSLWLPIAVHMLFNTTSLIATAVMQP